MRSHMQRSIPRSALVGACVTALAALSAGQALAAVTATTVAATAVKATSATLNGTVATDGSATPWQFGYGPISNAFTGTFTPNEVIPAGGSGSTPVSATVTNLIPATTYIFHVAATVGQLGSTLTVVDGLPPLTFTTKGAGSAALTSTKLKVAHGRVTVAIKCRSTIPCQGQLAITKRASGKKKPVACGSTSFTVKPGKKKTFTTGKLSGRCAALLAGATNGTISAHLEALFSSYQKTISKGVTLTEVVSALH